MSAAALLVASLRIRRPEYWIAEVPIVLVPILLAAPAPAAVWNAFVAEGLVLFVLLFHFGDLVNCLADRDLDAVYKFALSRAVYALGVRNVAIQTVASALAAIALAVHMSWVSGRWPLGALAVFGIVLAWAYSMPPIHFKSRGIGQLVCLWAVIFVVPMAIAELFVRDRVTVELVAIAASYAALQMGAILVNTAEDYPEDLQFGIRNTIVALGLSRGITLAAGLSSVGGATLLAALAGHIRARGLEPVAYAALAPLAASWMFVSIDLWRLARRVAKAAPAEAIGIVKATARRVPVWVTLDAWATLGAAAAVLWLGRGAGSP